MDPASDRKDLVLVVDTFALIQEEYHKKLGENLQSLHSESWAHTSEEWWNALLKTRDDILQTPHKLSSSLFREYFTMYPWMLNKGDQEHKLTPLMICVILRRPDLVRILIDTGADTNLETEEGESALSFARHYQLKEIVEMLEPLQSRLLSSWDINVD